jgi:hypothetical protein
MALRGVAFSDILPFIAVHDDSTPTLTTKVSQKFPSTRFWHKAQPGRAALHKSAER